MLGLYFTRCIAGKSCYVKAGLALCQNKCQGKKRQKEKARVLASYWSNDGEREREACPASAHSCTQWFETRAMHKRSSDNCKCEYECDFDCECVCSFPLSCVLWFTCNYAVSVDEGKNSLLRPLLACERQRIVTGLHKNPIKLTTCQATGFKCS